MTLLYYESFKTGAAINIGIDGGGDQDVFPNWKNSSLTRHSYTTGPKTGTRAIVVDERMWYEADHDPAYTRLFFGGWFKLSQKITGTVVQYLFSVGETGNVVQFRLNSNNDLLLNYNGDAVATIKTAALSRTMWNHVKVDIDSSTGNIVVWHNNVEVYNDSIEMTAFPTEYDLQIGRTLTGIQINNDNIVVNDFFIATEPFDGTQEILGVEVCSTQDRYETSSTTGFAGTLIVDGVRYEGQKLTSGIESLSYGSNHNVANVRHHKFYTNPATGEPWTEDSLETIDQWGVCCIPDGSNHKARLACLALCILRYNDGIPEVETIAPGSVAYFSGPWTKTNPELAFFAHVNKHPRDDDPDLNDVTSLFCDDYGCLLFNVLHSTDVTPIEKVGITFAEEKRVDYADWVLVIGGAGIDFESSFTSGYSIAGQADKFFANNYVSINYRNVSNGAAYAQGVWDFSTDADTGRWSMRQTVYGPNRIITGNYRHGVRKLLMRGQGRAMQIRVTSQSGKAFQINGWTMYITGNSKV